MCLHVQICCRRCWLVTHHRSCVFILIRSFSFEFRLPMSYVLDCELSPAFRCHFQCCYLRRCYRCYRYSQMTQQMWSPTCEITLRIQRNQCTFSIYSWQQLCEEIKFLFDAESDVTIHFPTNVVIYCFHSVHILHQAHLRYYFILMMSSSSSSSLSFLRIDNEKKKNKQTNRHNVDSGMSTKRVGQHDSVDEETERGFSFYHTVCFFFLCKRTNERKISSE